MKYAVISDVHANAEAMERALADARMCGVDEIICLGDIVGYGPLPAKSLALVRKHCSTVVAGNHDAAVAGRFDTSSFNDLARDAAERHHGTLGREDVAYLKSLPLTCRFGEAAGAHGDFTNPGAFEYVSSTDAAAASFAAEPSVLLFVGHTHIPAVYRLDCDGDIEDTGAKDFILERGKRYLVNPGSIGYPRAADGNISSTYAIYDTVKRAVVFRRLPFLVGSVMQRGKREKRWLPLLAATMLAAAGATGAVWFAMTRSVPDAITAAPEKSLLLVEEKVELPAGCGRIDPALQLGKGSKPVRLKIVFTDARGTVLASLDAIKKTKAGAQKIPTKAREAVFASVAIYKLDAGDKVLVESFTPQAVE